MDIRTLFYIIFTFFLYAGKVTGAIFIGMIVMAMVGMTFSVTPLPELAVSLSTIL